MSKSPITCHGKGFFYCTISDQRRSTSMTPKVLDSSTGKPAQGVAIHLEYLESDIFHPLVKGYIIMNPEIPII